MIPILIEFGLVFGRWWRWSLVVAPIGWTVTLVAGDVMELEWGLLAAAGLAVINTLVGILVHQGVLWLVRQRRHRRASPRTS